MSDSKNFFRDETLVPDPYPYFNELRTRCPVQREPHHGVVMVTGYEEAIAVYNDTETFSSCNSVTGPFPGFPVPLEGEDVSTATRCRSAISSRRSTRPSIPHIGRCSCGSSLRDASRRTRSSCGDSPIE